MHASSSAFLPVADTKCDATRDVTSCNATSGGSVYIQVMANASGHVVYCKKNVTSGFTKVFTLKNEQVKVNKDNAEFFIGNGTLKITGLSKNDTGQYSFDIFNQNGVHLRNVTLHLHVQGKYEPVHREALEGVVHRNRLWFNRRFLCFSSCLFLSLTVVCVRVSPCTHTHGF